MITAKGKINGESVRVIYENGEFLFNAKENDILEMTVREEMEKRHPVGGTYYPSDVNGALNIIEVLRYWLFDNNDVEIGVVNEEIEELPSEEGVVY